MKTIRVFTENFQFLEVKFSIYLNRRVSVMHRANIFATILENGYSLKGKNLEHFFFFKRRSLFRKESVCKANRVTKVVSHGQQNCPLCHKLNLSPYVNIYPQFSVQRLLVLTLKNSIYMVYPTFVGTNMNSIFTFVHKTLQKN